MAGKTKKPYYQIVLDKLATSDLGKEGLRAIRNVCVATEAKKKSDVRRTIREITTEFSSTETAFHNIPDTIWYETMFRLLAMNDTESMLRLIKWYRGFKGGLMGKKKTDYQGNNWQGMLRCVPRPEILLSNAALIEYWAMLERALKIAIPLFIKSPKPKPIEKNNVPLRTALNEGLVILFESLINAFQLFLDRGLEDLAKNGYRKDSPMSKLHKRWFGTRSRLLPAKNVSPLLLSLKIPKTQILETRRAVYFLDAFVPHKSRQFEFNFYERDDSGDDPESKTYYLRDLIRFIDNKLNFYLDQLGIQHKKPNLTKKAAITRSAKELAKRRKLVLKRLKKPRIKTDDELADFACALYRAHLQKTTTSASATRQEAWHRAIGFLGRYLRTQTTHTSFNLAEGPKYIDRLFPRAINGGQIHDCGVYAARMTNILLKFDACTAKEKKNKLDLDISFIILPLHVGLIVQGKEINPTFIHNQLIISLDDQQEKLWFDEWKNGEWKKHATDPDPTDAQKEKEKFWEDVAAQLFLRDLDMPLLRVDLTGVSTPPRKGQVDSAYKKLVAKNYAGLFSKHIERHGTDEFSFDLLFLEALSKNNQWYDARVIPLWNIKAVNLFITHSKDDALRKSERSRKKYADALEKAVKQADDVYDKVVRPKKEDISKLLRKKRKRVLGKKAQRITLSMRLKRSATAIGELGELRQHIKEIRNDKVHTPRFAMEGEFLTPISD